MMIRDDLFSFLGTEIFQGEGSGDEPQEIVHTQEIGYFYYMLRVHQAILPLAVCFLMWTLWSKRGRALATGREIDENMKKVKEAKDRKMAELEEKFIKEQLEAQAKSSEEKKEE